MAPCQVRLLTLNINENQQHKLYRLEKGWTLRFTLGPSLHAKKVRVFSNHPPNGDVVYERTTYYELHWTSSSGSRSDRHDVYTDVHVHIAGSFNYFFTIDGSDAISDANGQGYYLVDPTMLLGSDKEEITLDCVQCQSVLAKCLGPFDEWEGSLYVAKATGYNMVHFTPIQDLGQSNSSYSIKDQLKLNPVFNRPGQDFGFTDVENLVKIMNNDWHVLSLTDLVYNHTANNSGWLEEHPECSYNLENSPHLKPAFLVDRVLYHFSMGVADGKWEKRGVSAKIKSDMCQTVKDILLTEVFPECKLEQFYTVNIEEIMTRFKLGIEENRSTSNVAKELSIIQDPQFHRNQCRVDMDTALYLYNTDRPGATNRTQRIKSCCDDLRARLEQLNKSLCDQLTDCIHTAVRNFLKNVEYRFLDANGPKLGTVTNLEPMMHQYFIVPKRLAGGNLESEESLMYGNTAKYIFACNGWVMGDNPLKNFAEPGTGLGNVYLRRELVVWGDSVKLRYGQTPADCPYLWQRMREYTETTARIFHGVRLDNCHSTPIHVAEYMMDAARKIRPDLYVVAELFTGAEHLDNLFMNKLGINSLIREALNAKNSKSLGGMVHRYGGQPVGAFIQPRRQPLVPTVAHALFFDQTHDNPSAVEKRSVYDILPTAALVSMASCAIGSNRGYEQIVPHHIHVVSEKRKYPSWLDCPNPGPAHINQSYGVTRGKTLVNELHYYLGRTGFTQVYVDQIDGNCVSVTRHNPVSHESVILVARTSFTPPTDPLETGHIPTITIQGKIVDVLFEVQTCETEDFKYVKDAEYINGMPNYYADVKEHLKPENSTFVTTTMSDDGQATLVTFKKFTPGSIIGFRSVLPNKGHHAILEIRRDLGQFGYLMRSYSGRTMFDETWDTSNFRSIVSHLTLSDLNVVLFRCAAEERVDGLGFSTYNLPGYGHMLYCGLRGVTTVLGSLRAHNELGHPLCSNLREGNWLPSYIANRLKVHPGTKHLGMWFDNVFSHLADVPRYLIPCYFDAIVTGAYLVMREHTFTIMSEFVTDGSTFIQALAMGSVMFCGYVKDARLPQLSPTLAPPEPPTLGSDGEQACLSLAAGFPHFASSYTRNWGRDTFIALRGLLLLTGRYDEARYIILAFAGCLRHGLIPNLLSEGRNARYNCRDAVWWWLQAIQGYCKMAPDGVTILEDTVSRLYPTDDAEPQPPGKVEQPLYDVIQEALQCHSDGVKYRERNAGIAIDDQMSSEGFNNEIGVHWETGFVYGGTGHNCGTWMDKMGSASRAGNKGKPATPRDGSAVELVGLCASAVLWLHNMHAAGHYPHAGVTCTENGKDMLVKWQDWHEKICENFEATFWINTMPNPEETSPELIVRRGIYKDTHNATQFWSNTQLRPNFPVAMVVAPEIFSPEFAWTALNTMQEVLLGPLGMKTLDPKDWAYTGFYDNIDDSDNANIAKGFSYHQGPEWVWPIGYFLRAKLLFAKKLSPSRPGLLKETVNFIKTTLTRHFEEVMQSPWRSLPELTNEGGKPNHFGCPGQAWSMSCVLEVLYDLEMLDMETPLHPVRSKDDVIAPL